MLFSIIAYHVLIISYPTVLSSTTNGPLRAFTVDMISRAKFTNIYAVVELGKVNTMSEWANLIGKAPTRVRVSTGMGDFCYYFTKRE